MSKLIRKSNKGFTLIELMIVVAIIGILAAIAIPNFLRFQLKAKSSEGKVNIAAIRTAQESYLAEFGSYLVAEASPTAAVTNPGPAKVEFELTDGDTNGFNSLGWSPEGRVFFAYEVNAVDSAYTITAQADIDGDDVNQVWGLREALHRYTGWCGSAKLRHVRCGRHREQSALHGWSLCDEPRPVDLLKIDRPSVK